MKNIEKASLLKKELDLLRPLNEEAEQRVFQKIRLDWNFHSNKLEGNALTYGETKALILHGLTAQGKPLKDHFEITGHNEAITYILEIVKQERSITEHFIRELHTLILKEPYEVDTITPDGLPSKKKITVGAYKSMPNHVRTATGEMFWFATPEETPAKMDDLMQWYTQQSSDEAYNPVLLAAEFHYKFIRIHPFDDGNGRTARLLMNFILMQRGYAPAIIKSTDKEQYLSALMQADSGNLGPFVEYIAENVVKVLDLMIRAANGESIEEQNDYEKEVLLLQQQLSQAGKLLSTTKSLESLRHIFDNSVVQVMQKLVEKCHIYDAFYTKKDTFLLLDGTGSAWTSSPDNLNGHKTNLSEHTYKLQLEYNHFAYKHKDIDAFNYESVVVFEFQTTRYTVSNNVDVVLKKFYDELLSESEIQQLIDGINKKHLEVIKAKTAQEI